jgi:hypothetical protein
MIKMLLTPVDSHKPREGRTEMSKMMRMMWSHRDPKRAENDFLTLIIVLYRKLFKFKFENEK